MANQAQLIHTVDPNEAFRADQELLESSQGSAGLIEELFGQRIRFNPPLFSCCYV